VVPDPETICAVVVTHDRRDLLRECLTALHGQTRPPDEILVVDNASSDGTADMLAADFPDVRVRRLDTNEGGAGGFHEGMLSAYEDGFEWLWLMDDDTIPTPTALERLLEGRDTASTLGEAPVALASKVVWIDGRLHPMNVVVPALQRMDGVVEAASHGLLLIRSASWVSLLVHRRAIERFGLPIKRYFIWTDDVEFTARVLRWESGYLVPESVVHHKTATAYTTAEGSRERFFYYVRNALYMTRGRAWDTQEKLQILWRLLVQIRRFLRNNRWSPGAALVVARGLAHGVATPADDGAAGAVPSRDRPAADPPKAPAA
jgi:rhamnopyranosyl-N-acetylglucosaminyl-diphospho-decaprenol beta-1,3/1,4-galactofuranosyltransferase